MIFKKFTVKAVKMTDFIVFYYLRIHYNFYVFKELITYTSFTFNYYISKPVKKLQDILLTVFLVEFHK